MPWAGLGLIFGEDLLSAVTPLSLATSVSPAHEHFRSLAAWHLPRRYPPWLRAELEWLRDLVLEALEADARRAAASGDEDRAPTAAFVGRRSIRFARRSPSASAIFSAGRTNAFNALVAGADVGNHALSAVQLAAQAHGPLATSGQECRGAAFRGKGEGGFDADIHEGGSC